MNTKDAKKYLAGIIGDGAIEFTYIPIKTEVLKIAIQALERQIPKKPAMWGDGYADGELVMESYECPHCGKVYDFEADGELKFCCECGQALDWTEEGAD